MGTNEIVIEWETGGFLVWAFARLGKRPAVGADSMNGWDAVWTAVRRAIEAAS